MFHVHSANRLLVLYQTTRGAARPGESGSTSPRSGATTPTEVGRGLRAGSSLAALLHGQRSQDGQAGEGDELPPSLGRHRDRSASPTQDNGSGSEEGGDGGNKRVTLSDLLSKLNVIQPSALAGALSPNSTKDDKPAADLWSAWNSFFGENGEERNAP